MIEDDGPTLKSLGGEMAPGSWDFVAPHGPLPNPIGHVFPIMSHGSTGTWRLIGTGFHIGPLGLFVTAKHVIEDVFEHGTFVPGKQVPPIAILQMYSQSGLFGPDGFAMRPITHSWLGERADIALATAAQLVKNETGEQMPDPRTLPLFVEHAASRRRRSDVCISTRNVFTAHRRANFQLSAGCVRRQGRDNRRLSRPGEDAFPVYSGGLRHARRCERRPSVWAWRRCRGGEFNVLSASWSWLHHADPVSARFVSRSREDAGWHDRVSRDVRRTRGRRSDRFGELQRERSTPSVRNVRSPRRNRDHGAGTVTPHRVVRVATPAAHRTFAHKFASFCLARLGSSDD